MVRSYIFGDEITAQQGREAVGVPTYAGYALGYKLVQAYLTRTGKSVVEATYTPSAESSRNRVSSGKRLSGNR